MSRRKETEANETEQLLPADIDDILDKYGHLLNSYPNLSNRESIFVNYKRVDTEPHHHHYDPSDRKKRRENYDVRTLNQAFTFVEKFLKSKEGYNP